MDSTHHRDERGAHHDVVEVRDNEVCVVQMDVDVERAKRKSGETTDREQEHKREPVEHRGV